MKGTKIIIILVLFFGIVGFFSNCEKQSFNEPEQNLDTVDFESNISIKDLKDTYYGGMQLIDTNFIIRGTIIANDKSGNNYKTIVIQDSTAGIEIGLNATELHNDFPVGQLIYIKCKGLYLGDYGGVVKLGSDYEGEIGRIEEPLIKLYLYKSSGGLAIEPQSVSIDKLGNEHLNTLIKLENVQFKSSETGKTYADAVYNVDYFLELEDCQENSTVLLTSGYADFASDTLPTGNGNITAIYSKYNNSDQFVVRNVNEVNLINKRCGAWFKEDFNEFASLGIFSGYSVKGDIKAWEQSAGGGLKFAKMTGYYSKTYEESEDWLISNAINLSGQTNAKLSFSHCVNYFTSYDDTKVFICDDYDGQSNPNNSGTWTEITNYTNPNGHNWDFVNSGDIDISDYDNKQEVYIAFKYLSEPNDACTWEIDWVQITVD